MTTITAPTDKSRVSSGVSGLDAITLGGWPVHHLYLIEGDPGTGKTTLALQFLLEGAQRGERVLYVTLSESKQELEGVAASHKWPLDNVEIFEFLPNEDSLNPENEYSALHPRRSNSRTRCRASCKKLRMPSLLGSS